MRRREIEQILGELGGAQHGVVARSQLLARGLQRHAVDGLVRAQRIQLIHRGVYQVGPGALPLGPAAAAVLACGNEGGLSHRSAGALLGMARAGTTMEVIMPRRRRRKIEGIRIHRSLDLRDDEITVYEGIRVTTPARTLLDIAETITERELEQALAEALRRKLVTRADVQEMVDRHPTHRGAVRLRKVVNGGEEPAFTRSEAEEKLLEIVRSAGLPRPQLNARVLGHEVDFLWRAARVVAEVDGWAFHSSERAFVEDRRRDAELTAAGYSVLRFTWPDLHEGRFATVVRLARALVRNA